MMKSSFKKLRDFTRSKSSPKDKRSDRHGQHEDAMVTIATNMQVLIDMREKYDGLMAAAKGVSGSSYDFSRAIHEMASYMLETFGKIGDGDTGSSFSMLGKVQYEISKQLSLYATHVSETIIKPTENLLKELESVENIKKDYEKKRELYNRMRLQKPKGRCKKGEASEEQLMTVNEQLNDKATQFDLRFQSLRHDQELSLVTQAARHHMAQVHLFGRGLNSLNAVESIIKNLSNEFHIDQTLSEGDIGLQLNANSYNDDEESMSSSPSSSQPITAENLLREAANPKPWEKTSKSAPLHFSSHVTTKDSPVGDVDADMLPEKEVTTYMLPSPTDSAARFHSQATNSAIKAEAPHPVERRRTRTGSAGSFEETSGLAGLLKVQAYKPGNLAHAMAQEEEPYGWKEKKSAYHARRSPSHSHSTSFSGHFHSTSFLGRLDPWSLSSYGHSTSTPTFSYKQTTRDNDANVRVTHGVDPLFKSGPIGRSAPWGLSPSRVSPCTSPPVSHLSPPLISELHKLPAPPKSNKVVGYSVPLGMKAPEPGGESAATTPSDSSSAVAVVQKSRSIPSSVDFARNLHNTKLIKVHDSPVVESP